MGSGRRARALSLVWSILLAIGVVALAGSLMLPSTKRARIDFRHQQPQTDETGPSTAPSSEAATRP
jgi:hypothetical protein